MEHLVTKAFDYGVPTGLLVMAAVGAVWLCRWLRAEVVRPLVASHLGLVNALQAELPRQTDELREQTRVLNRIEKNGCGHAPAFVEHHEPA